MNPLSTLCGGEEITVAMLDGSSQTVKVIQFGVNLCQHYAAIVQAGDEAQEIEFLCQNPEGWAATLSPQSQEAIIELGNRLNADFFSRWLDRRSKRSKALPKPDMSEMAAMLDVLSKSNPGLLDNLLSRAAGQAPAQSLTSPPKSQ